MAENAKLEDLDEIRSKSMPASCERILASAERRLLGSIKHEESAPRIAANAERVRRAQLGCFHARSRVAELPTDDDDEQTRRASDNLTTSSAAWKQLSVEEIAALYTQRLSK